MLCTIYKSSRQAEMYLYVAKTNDFSAVPSELMQIFGKPQLVIIFNLAGTKQLRLVSNQTVQQHIEQQGFYLQMPEKKESLLEQFLQEQKLKKAL